MRCASRSCSSCWKAFNQESISYEINKEDDSEILMKLISDLMTNSWTDGELDRLGKMKQTLKQIGVYHNDPVGYYLVKGKGKFY